MFDCNHLLKSFDLAYPQLLFAFLSFSRHLDRFAGDAKSDAARVRVIDLGGVIETHDLLAFEAIDRSLGLLVTLTALSRNSVSHDDILSRSYYII